MCPSRYTELLQCERQSKEGSDTAGGDEVVAASVTDTRERVVLGVEVDQSPARSTNCFEGGIQSVSMAGDLEPLFLEEIADGIVGTVFFIGELRIGPYLGEAGCESLYTSESIKLAGSSLRIGTYLMIHLSERLLQRIDGNIDRGSHLIYFDSRESHCLDTAAEPVWEDDNLLQSTIIARGSHDFNQEGVLGPLCVTSEACRLLAQDRLYLLRSSIGVCRRSTSDRRARGDGLAWRNHDVVIPIWRADNHIRARRQRGGSSPQD